MIGNKLVLGLILARGGSKGLPRKNIRQIGGKPMIAWTIEAGKQSQYIDRLILSSEDDEIIDTARQFECEIPFVRPKNLATDESSPLEVIRHAIESLPEKYDYLVLLQPTSPLRIANDIDRCLELCYQEKAPACVTITESEKTPYWMYELLENHRMHPVIPGAERVVRRQDLPKTYALNGAVFVARSDWIICQNDFLGPDTIGCEMPRVRSIDIDSETDLVVANALLKEMGLG
jgi:CMP-N,N'-diacetyllegionaminic acid synthase